jgi:hypothetical protein
MEVGQADGSSKVQGQAMTKDSVDGDGPVQVHVSIPGHIADVEVQKNQLNEPIEVGYYLVIIVLLIVLIAVRFFQA